MTDLDFSKLNTGDIVRSKSTGVTYVVHVNFGRHVTAVAVADLTNPSEWEIAAKSITRPIGVESLPPRG